MKKIIYTLFFLTFLFAYREVYAASLNISGDSSAQKNKNYTIKINYSGSDNLASGTIVVNYSNATCTITANVTGAIANGNKININNVDGVGTSATLATLTCTSSQSGTATITVNSNDLYDVDVNVIADDSSPISGSKNITINEPPVEKPSTPQTPTTPKTPDTPKTPTTPKNQDTPKNPTPPTEPTEPTTPQTPPTPVEPDEPVVPSEPLPVKELYLTSLEIIGYKINFSKDIFEYSINVDKNVTDLYITADAEEDIDIENIGKININEKDELRIKLKQDGFEKSYTIKINRINNNNKVDNKSFTIFSFLLNIILLITIVMLLVNKLHMIEKHK